MPTFTLSQISGLILDELDNSPEFPQGQITSAINHGLYWLNILTGYQQITIQAFTVSPSSTSSPWLYEVPSGILIPTRLDIEGIALSPPISLRKLASQFRDWSTDTTASMGPISQWARIGLTAAVIHPYDSDGGQLMEWTGVQPMSQLVNAGDVVTLDNQFVDVLVEWCRMRATLKEPFQSFQQSLKQMPELQRKISTMSRWERVRQPSFWISKTQAEAKGIA